MTLENYRSLANFHVPLELKKSENEIISLHTSIENKSWIVRNELQLPSRRTPFVCRLNGTISYAFENTITTWNWQSNKFEINSLSTIEISALAELKSGSLIVGDTNGHIYTENCNSISVEEGHSISEILVLDSDYVIVKFSKNFCSLVNIKKKSKYCSFPETTKICVIKEGLFASINNKFVIKCCKIGKEFSECKKHSIISFLNGKIETTNLTVDQLNMRSESDYLLIILKSGIVVFNTVDSFRSKVYKIQTALECFIFLPPETLVYADTSSDNLKFRTEKDTEDSVNAPYNVRCVILLSDRSIMYGTVGTVEDGTGYQLCIHVVTQNREVVFSSTKMTSTEQNHKPLLTELVDGSVAIKLEKSICIIRPQTKPPSNMRLEIDTLYLKLQYQPDELDLYHQLANVINDPESMYNTLLAGLKAAIKNGNLYQARRFYERTRKMDTKRKGPIVLFLDYLKHSCHKKLERRIRLDWYAFKRQRTKQEIEKKINLQEFGLDGNRKCKRRLFIGEGDFSYTNAIINKHRHTHIRLAKSITATDISGSKNVEKRKRITDLEKKGVEILFGIDGQQIDQLFRGKRFERIHWNCPFWNLTLREKFKTVLPSFFQSCNQLQLVGDRIHVTLKQENDGYWKHRQLENPIVLGSTLAAYRLIRKRHFGNERYEKYNHVKTDGANYPLKGELREFVFEKTEKTKCSNYLELTNLKKAKALQNLHEKKYKIKSDGPSEHLKDFYFECTTDEDSSDYYASGEEKEDEATRSQLTE